jgi:predicted RNA-binding Zn-ribbon protein involved in translation (DUF1610 family)
MPVRWWSMQFAAPTHERADFLPCPRCGMRMAKIVTIAPMGRQPGLVAYECPKCAYVTSVLASRATGRPAARPREDAVIGRPAAFGLPSA